MGTGLKLKLAYLPAQRRLYRPLSAPTSRQEASLHHAVVREALDLTDILGGDYGTALQLFRVSPMAPVVARALDESNPRPLRASAQDFDTLLSAVDTPTETEPMFLDLTRKSTARPVFRDGSTTDRAMGTDGS